MTTHRNRLGRRLLALVASSALAAGLIAATAPAATAAPATTTGSGPTKVTDASFAWGWSGYAQDGIFGPWTWKDFTGNASYLEGNVSTNLGTVQSEYDVAPVPATSFPTSKAGKQANAVRFSNGTGLVDVTTGRSTLSWTGSFTLNAYPTQYNAPNEIISDPTLTIAADGSGTLVADFTIGAGTTMSGDPFEEQDFGRLKVATFSAGSLSDKTTTGYRITPDYQGVAVPAAISGQNTTCTTSGGATGWWGAWPSDYVTALNSHESGQSVLAHYYSTGCGGKNDTKPALPIDVTFTAAPAPTVTVSETTVAPGQTPTVTITGANFDPTLATGTRAPYNGLPGGTYVAFAKVADVWQPSQGAASSTRGVASSNTDLTRWAVPAAQMGSGPAYAELGADGSFSIQLKIDRETLETANNDAVKNNAALTKFGIITYPGSGAVAPAYETFTPLTFEELAAPAADLTVSALPSSWYYSQAVTAKVDVTGNRLADLGAPTGSVVAKIGSTVVGEGTVDEDGVAQVAISRTLAVGSRAITFTYEGDDTYPAVVSAAQTVVVKQASVSLVTWLTRYPTRTATGAMTAVVQVPSGSDAARGKVQLWLKSGSRTITGTATLVNGRVAITLPKLARGTWSVQAQYLGQGNHRWTPVQVTKASFWVS